jgi:hypothetical protein
LLLPAGIFNLRVIIFKRLAAAPDFASGAWQASVSKATIL